ncbi:MAG: hypothetical protein M1338_04095 [Patescibacteria group bacterium]|nr:hypothetical protein [Patescibacteria group bacterium]
MKKILALIVFSLFLVIPSILHAEDFKITEVKLSNFGMGGQDGPAGGSQSGPPGGQQSSPSSSEGSFGARPTSQTGSNQTGTSNSVYYSINFTTNLPTSSGDLLIKSKENDDQKLEIFGFTRLSEVGSKETAQKISDTEFSFPNAGHPLFTDIFYGDWIIVEATSTSGQKVFSDVYFITTDGKLEQAGSVATGADPTSQNKSSTPNQTSTAPTSQPSNIQNIDKGQASAQFTAYCKNYSGSGLASFFTKWACGLFAAEKSPITAFDSPYATRWGMNFFVINILSMYLMNIIVFVGLGLYIIWIITKIRPYGIVFDSKTKSPIQGAIVRIFDAEKNKLLETKVTDQAGNYNFIVKPGLYYISIIIYQFSFPTKLITKNEIPQYYRVYKGEMIRVTRNTNLSINIPLDPQGSDINKEASISSSKKIFNVLIYYLLKLRWVFIFVALASGIFLYTIKMENWYIYLAAGLFGLIIEIVWYLASRKIQFKEKTKP